MGWGKILQHEVVPNHIPDLNRSSIFQIIPYIIAMQCRASSSPERSRSANRGSRASSTSSSSERRQAHSARLYLAAHGYQPHTLEEFRAQGYDAKRERYWTLGTLGADVDTEELQVGVMSCCQAPCRPEGKTWCCYTHQTALPAILAALPAPSMGSLSEFIELANAVHWQTHQHHLFHLPYLCLA